MQAVIRYIERNHYLCLVSLVSITFAIINYGWARADLTPPSWDPAWYLQNSQELYHALIKGGFPSLVQAFSHALGGSKAPLITILPLPFYLLLGSGEVSAICVNLIFSVLLSYFLFKLVSLIENERAAFVAVLTLQSIPLCYALCRQFYVEYALTTFVVIYCYVLLKSNFFSDDSYNTLQGVVLGLGLLTKITFPLYVFGPIIYCIYMRLRNNDGNSLIHVVKELTKIVLIAIAISSIFYFPNRSAILSFAFSSGFGDVGKYYGLGDVFALSTMFKYWKILAMSAISYYYTAFTIAAITVGIIYLLFIVKTDKTKATHKFTKIFPIYILWFIVPFIVFTFGVNKEIRFILPILPAVSIIVGIFANKLLSGIRQGYIFILIIALFVSYPIYIMMQSSFNQQKQYTLYLVHAPSNNDWRSKDIMNYIYLEANKEGFKNDMASRNVVVAVEHPAVNYNTYEYMSSTTMEYLSNPVHFYSLGYAETDIGKTIKMISDTDPLFIIFGENMPKGSLSAFLNVLNDKVRSLADKGQLPYSYSKSFRMQNGANIVLYKRATATTHGS